MAKIIRNKISLISAIVALICGFFWALKTDFEFEPLILIIVSMLEILGYFLTAKGEDHIVVPQKVKTLQKVSLNLNIGQNTATGTEKVDPAIKKIDRTKILDSMSNRISILFIDDDSKFNVVKILKDSGWKKTKTVVDIKTLDVPVVRDADIIFVDINGVGKFLNLEYEGLDLALMLKQKYPEKKVIIYSANRNSNSFHDAWNLCDFKLEKNALPYQFQNLVEEYSIEKYKKEG